MRMPHIGSFLLGLTLGALVLPVSGRAQERTVVSKQVSVGRSEAELRLEFASGDPLDISLHDGSVFIDGEVVGAYQAGDDLDAAWRTLLGEAVRLDDGPLAETLRDWSPPSDLEGDRLELASRIDTALQDALTPRKAPEAPPAPSVQVSVGGEGDAALVRALLGHAGRLSTLEEALKDAGPNVKLHIGENVEVGAGETIDGTLVVVQGDARIDGEVHGDVVVIDGTLDLGEGSRVEGDVRLADATLHRDGGTVEGEVVNVQRQERDLEREIRDRLREELRSEMRSELRNATRTRSSGSSLFSPFRALFRTLGGLFENLVSVLVLGLIGMGIVAFAPRNLDTVAETARRAPGRAAMVGVAGTFLLIPVWVLGAVALAVSIVGIPVMIAWLPLFPLAAVAAALLGYLAVARNVGEWLSDSGYRYTDRIRKSNPVHTIFAGVLGLAAFFIVANLLRVVPFFGFFRGLLTFAGVMFGIVAMQIGFGAVLLTRAGRRREAGPVDFDEAWERAVDVEVEVEMETTAGADGPAREGAEGEEDA